MQENAWRPGLRPGPRWASLQRSLDPLASGEGWRLAGWLLSPQEPLPGPRLSSPHNFRTPSQAKILSIALHAILVLQHFPTFGFAFWV